MRAAEKKQYDRQNAYNRDHYERIGTVVPKGTKDRLKAKAEGMGLTVNAYLKKVVLESLEE